MEKKKVVEALARVSTLSQGVIESEKNSNNLLDLIEYLNYEDSVPLLKATLQALVKVYSHLVHKHYTWIVPPSVRGVAIRQPLTEGGSKSSGNVTDQYRDWMRQNYVNCLDRVVEMVHCKFEEVQWTALCSLMSLVQAEGHAHQSTVKAYIYPNNLFHNIVSRLLDNNTDRCDLIGRFADEYLQFDDVRFNWLKNIASIISSRVDALDSVTISEHFVKNCHCALKLVTMPLSEEDIGEFFSGVPPDLSPWQQDPVSDDSDTERDERPPKAKRSKRETKALTVRCLQKHQKQFSDAWLAFLRLPLSRSLCKQVLVSLHSEVIPHMVDPRLLLDFLTHSYNEGGVVGLLALNGLFLLMNQHHLDYPDFYNKLYQLLEPSVFHVKYMQRFFHLLDTFLQSTHLALYLVAAFVKKIARLALSAPPNGVMVGVVLVCNLLKRHPNCKVLLHRQEGNSAHRQEGDSTPSTDTFDLSEPDPAKCGALESSLWELKTLQSHYCPAVSKLVRQQLEPSKAHSKIETDLGKYLDIDNEQLFEEVCADLNALKAVPLNFKEPTTLWQANI